MTRGDGRASVVLAEDHDLMARELSELLEQEFRLLGVVTNGLALVEATARLKPDVIVVDVSMPVKDGIAAVAEILRHRPALPAVFVSVHDAPGLVARAFAVGARGYVLKHAAAEELVRAVKLALRGGHHLSPGLRGSSSP